MATSSKKSNQIAKCMNLSMSEGATEEEAIAAFKAARKLSIKLKESGEEIEENTTIAKDYGNITPKEGFEFVNMISHISKNNDVMVDITFSGSTEKPELKIDFTGAKGDIKSVFRKIEDFKGQANEREGREKREFYEEFMKNYEADNDRKKKTLKKASNVTAKFFLYSVLAYIFFQCLQTCVL
jgi:hypothetical protein